MVRQLKQIKEPDYGGIVDDMFSAGGSETDRLLDKARIQRAG